MNERDIEEEGAGRRWAGRIALVALGALLVPVLLEAALRLAGYGYPTAFLLPYKKGGERVWVDNQFFGYRFFPPPATRTAQPIVVPVDKAPGEYRVVVLGESAAMGDPLPDFGLPRVLEVVLAERLPGRRVRVINAAMTAINSHVVREIARELPRLQPDAVVVYLGNNEVIGPYAPGTVLRAFAASGAYVRGSVLFSRTRLAQLLGGGRHEAAGAPEQWGGMAMFLRQELPWQDPRLAHVYENFGRNLEVILQLGQAQGARVVVGTVAVSRRDCPPLGSRNRWAPEGEALWEKGLRAEQAEEFDSAISSYEALLKGDDGSAELHYRLARCLEQRGRDADAELHYIAACDRDTLRFRADTRINELVRRAARLQQADFVDTVKALRHVPDADVFVDHVHFSLAGNVRLARLLADALVPVPAGAAPLEDEVRRCADALAFTPWDQLEQVETIRERMEQPPFNRQREAAARVAALRARERALAEQARTLSRDATQARFARALERRPDDWTLLAHRGGRRFEEGDVAGGAEDLAAAVAAVPHRFDVRGDLAHCLAVLGRPDEGLLALLGAGRKYGHFMDHILRRISDELIAQGRFQVAVPFLDELVRRRPRDPAPLLRRAEARLRSGQTVLAAGELEQVVSASPTSGHAKMLLGLARLELGATNEAVRLLREATILKPELPETLYSLGYGLLRTGDAAGAEAAFRRTLDLDPADPDALLRLAELLAGRGEWAEAAEKSDALARLRPESWEVRHRAARAWAAAGRYASARDGLETCLQMNGDNLLVMNDLSWLLATCPEVDIRDGRRALEVALRADELTQYRDPAIIDALAASYAALGDFGSAMEAANRARSLAQDPLATCIAKRLALYESGQSYVSPGDAATGNTPLGAVPVGGGPSRPRQE